MSYYRVPLISDASVTEKVMKSSRKLTVKNFKLLTCFSREALNFTTADSISYTKTYTKMNEHTTI